MLDYLRMKHNHKGGNSTLPVEIDKTDDALGVALFSLP